MKAVKSNWLYIKIGLYGFLLYSVFAAMQYVKSPSFSGNVDVLMGNPSQARTLNWCSNSVQVVFLVPGERTIREPKVIQELCHLPYSSYNAVEIEGAKWSPFMKSMSEKGEEVVLEVDQTFQFLKQGGLIYKVDGLKNKLTSHGLPIE